jgi:hypothetical protein
MLTAAREETLSAPMVWTDECVLRSPPLVYPKTRLRGSEPENLPCFSATAPLRIELRWGCEECSEKTAAGSGVRFKYDSVGPADLRILILRHFDLRLRRRQFIRRNEHEECLRGSSLRPTLREPRVPMFSRGPQSARGRL